MRLPFVSEFVALSVCWLLLMPSASLAADLRIEAAEVLPDGRFRLRFEADPASYYRLFHGPDLLQIRDLVQISQQSPIFSPTSGKQGFFLLERQPRSGSLDSDGDGLPDAYELSRASLRPLDPTDALRDFDGDGFSNLDEFRNGTDPDVANPGLTTLTTSPGNGDNGVSVHRETVLTFSRPLAPDTLLTAESLRAESLGRAILTRRALSPDRRRATLFYLEPLPSGARVRVSIDGSRLLDEQGHAVDVDRDGNPGGNLRVEFDTFSSQPMSDTAVVGRVFASDLQPGGDTGTNALNRPLAGVIITVDGKEETLRAVTDASGNFRLAPCPAGRFFVKVDGRTAVGSEWPQGAYYPVVGKAWEAVPGRPDNLAGGTGEIFLPRIAPGTLRPVSSTRNTTLEFPPDVTALNPALLGVQVIIPPNSLADDAGLRGGRVGIAPVPPDRLPEPLPDDLQFPIVITVQTDGPMNFGIPAPVCFPNLPDPVTGAVGAPGSKSALWSFDHDKGYWEIVGSMTVSPDGSLVCSDPGVGIQQPGWHGTRPGASGSGGQVEEEEETCSVLVLGPIGGTTNVVYSFGTSMTEAGSWSWTAPGGDPASGSGPDFTTTFGALGNYQIQVVYTSADGERECTDVHNIEIAADTCRVSIRGAVEVVEGVRERFESSVHPAGGRFQWVEGEGGRLLRSENEPNMDVIWSQAGESSLRLTYTMNPDSEHPESCTDEVHVFVSERLEILDHRELPIETELTPMRNDEVYVHANLLNVGGRYAWSASAGVVIESPSSSHTRLTFTSPGVKVVQTIFTPFNQLRPTQTRVIPIRVRDFCTLEVNPFRNTTDRNQAVTLTATTQPASGGTVRWEAVGATPATGTGRTFTTRYPQDGSYQVNVFYDTEQGETCESLAVVQVGPVDCRVTITGPSVMQPGEVSGFSAIGNGTGGGFYSAKIVSTGENLGFAQLEAGVPFEFPVSLGTPGTHHVEVFYSGSFDLQMPGDCRSVHTITIPGTPAPAPQLAETGPQGGSVPKVVTGPNFYARMNLGSPSIRRGVTGVNGIAHPKPTRVPANAQFREFLLNPRSMKIAIQDYASPSDGNSFFFPTFRLMPDLSPDGDNDGLSDLAEFVVGTDPKKPDTDGDGALDGAEVRAGTSALGADAEDLGPVGGAPTSGYAWDVCVEDGRALVAAGDAGLEVFNIFEGLPPVQIGRLSLPGSARAVASGGGTALVAVEGAGVAVVDLQVASEGRLKSLLPTRSRPQGLAINGSLAAAALEDGTVLFIEAGTGVALRELSLGYSLMDLLIDGNRIYTVGLNRDNLQVGVLELREGSFNNLGTVAMRGSPGAGGRRVRLVQGAGRLYVIHTAGFNVLELNPSGLPTVTAQVFTGQFGWRHAAIMGDTMLAAADPASTSEGDHDVQIHRLNPSDGTAVFESEIPTPGSAEAVAIQHGIGYVADGAAGLRVVRFLASERGTTPPTVAFVNPPAEGRIEEAKPLVLGAVANDDVGVARVDFLLDGVQVQSDGSAPFELRLLTPRRAPGREFLRLQARAVDTAGNTALSPELRLELTADASAPFATTLSPAPGSEIANEPLRAVHVVFNEPLDGLSIGSNSVSLFSAGTDGLLGTQDDQPVAGSVSYVAATATLRLLLSQPVARGRFRAVLAGGLRDRVGNANSSSLSWEFVVVGPRITQRIPQPGGRSGGRQLEVQFSSALDVASLTGVPSITSAGVDGQFDTADDVAIPALRRYLPGSTRLHVQFDPALAPGGYRVGLPATLANGAGILLGTNVAWDLMVTELNLDTNAVAVSGRLSGAFALDEYRLVVKGGGDFALNNPNLLRVILLSEQGAPMTEDSRSLVKFTGLENRKHFLQFQRGAGAGAVNYSAELRRFSTRTTSHVLIGDAPQLFAGRSNAGVGDEDEFLLTAVPGESYFVQVVSSTPSCPARWTAFGPDGTPRVFELPLCSEGVVVSCPTGGVIRVMVENLRAGRGDVRVTRSQQRRFAVDLTGLDQYSSTLDPQFSGSNRTLNPGDTALVTLSVPAGERYFLTDPSGSFACLAISLARPDGQFLFQQSCDGSRPLEFREGGSYVLAIRNTAPSVQTLSLSLARIGRRVLEVIDLTSGGFREVSQTPLLSPGSEDVHPIQMTAGQRVVFSRPGFTPCHEWELRDPQGSLVFGPVSLCDGFQTVLAAQSGRYLLTIRTTPESLTFSPSYQITVGIPGATTTDHDLSTESEFLETGRIPLPGSKRVFNFQLLADQLIRFEVGFGGEGCNGDASADLFQPDGNLLVRADPGECGFSGFRNLALAGIYRLELTLAPTAASENYFVRLMRARKTPGTWRAGVDTVNPLQGAGTALRLTADGSQLFVAGPFGSGVGVGRRVAAGWELLGMASRNDDVPVKIHALVDRGPELYAVGNFTSVGGVPASGIARWNGSAWEALGTGIEVTASDFSNTRLEARDVAFLGTDLYVTGLFRTAGGAASFNLSRWDGAQWRALPGPLGSPHLDGVGGQRNDIGEYGASLAEFNGTMYVAGLYQFPGWNVAGFGAEGFQDGLFGGVMRSSFNPGSAKLVRSDGELLYVLGDIGIAGVNFSRTPVEGLAVWTGGEWRRGLTAVPSVGVEDFAVHGGRVVVGGTLDRLRGDTAAGQPDNPTVVQGLGIWKGSAWFAAGQGVEDLDETGVTPRLSSGSVTRLQWRGNRIHVTGRFNRAGGRPASFYAIWEDAAP